MNVLVNGNICGLAFLDGIDLLNNSDDRIWHSNQVQDVKTLERWASQGVALRWGWQTDGWKNLTN